MRAFLPTLSKKCRVTDSATARFGPPEADDRRSISDIVSAGAPAAARPDPRVSWDFEPWRSGTGPAFPAAMSFIRDARLGIRLLWRQPGFTVIALLTLALGIAANTAIFTVVYATLLAPLPYEHGDRIVMVWSRVRDNRNGSAAGTYEEWKRRSPLVRRPGGVDRTQRQPRRARPAPRSGAGAPRHARLRHDPRLQDDARTRLPARGRRARQRSGGRPRQPLLADALQRRPLDRRQDHPRRRQAPHGGRRARAEYGGSPGKRDVPAARVPARSAQSRLPLAAGDGPAETRM